MSRKRFYVYLSVIGVLLFLGIILKPDLQTEEYLERVKVSLRNVGNELLLQNNDSLSLVLPVTSISTNKFELSFEKELSFEPGFLVSTIRESFQKSRLPKFYRVEVLQCHDGEVAYSYEIYNDSEKDIVPCGSRYLPEACYTIQVKFTHIGELANYQKPLLIIFLLILGIFIFDLLFQKRKKNAEIVEDVEYTSLGSFKFYPDQNKLVKAPDEIKLSRKECEILAIFVAKKNQIVTREELTKRVWEDQGVFVGRSLDTYISKLRKKLKDDERIRLSNVHGVGYKLEVES